MPKRMIDQCMWGDEHFGSLSDRAKLLFIACIIHADDEGRLSGNLNNIRAIAFRFEDISLKQVESLLSEVESSMRHFKRYEADGRKYISFLKWLEYQHIRKDRFTDSKIPPYDNQMTTKRQPKDGIDKVRLDKVSIDKSRACFDFESLWTKYPNKDGKQAAERYFKSSVKTEGDYADIQKAIKNYNDYIVSDKIESKYIKNGSTFFNNWKDWIIPPKRKEVKHGLPPLKLLV